MKDMFLSRRRCLQVSALVGGSMLLGGRVLAAEGPIAAPETGELRSLMEMLAKAPRRRDFKTVPMILDTPGLWDAEALGTVIAYRASRKQVWDNTDIGGPWLNLMRNSLNAQVFSFRHPDFLEVSATHGSAQLALYDQAMWDKYQLAAMAGHDFKTNTLIDPKDVPTNGLCPCSKVSRRLAQPSTGRCGCSLPRRVGSRCARARGGRFSSLRKGIRIGVNRREPARRITWRGQYVSQSRTIRPI
jgi:hypothetical protein